MSTNKNQTEQEKYFERKNRRHRAWVKFWKGFGNFLFTVLVIGCIAIPAFALIFLVSAAVDDHNRIASHKEALVGHKEQIEVLEGQVAKLGRVVIEGYDRLAACEDKLTAAEIKIDSLTKRIEKLEPPKPAWTPQWAIPFPTNYFATNLIWFTNASIPCWTTNVSIMDCIITNPAFDHRQKVRIPDKHPGRQP